MGAVESGPPLSWLVEEDNVLWEQIQSLAASGQIDPIDNMLDDNVYIFQGTLDSVVPFCESSIKTKLFNIILSLLR